MSAAVVLPMETAGNCSDQTSGQMGTVQTFFLKRLQAPVLLYNFTATLRWSKLLAALVIGAAVTMCALLSLGISSNSCAFGRCFEGISAADIGTAGSSHIGSSGSDISLRDFLLNPANIFQNSAPSNTVLQTRGGCHCACDSIRGTHQQGPSTVDSIADGANDKAAGSLVYDAAAGAPGEAVVVARAGKAAGGGEGAPAAEGGEGGVEVTVADLSASEDVDLHKLYQSLSAIAWWMRNTNKGHFPELMAGRPPSPPSQDSSSASGGSTAGGGLDAVQLVTASIRSACRAASAPGMQLKGRKFLMLAQTWEQLSQTRLHLIEAMALAKMLNRTLVLTQVG